MPVPANAAITVCADRMAWASTMAACAAMAFERSLTWRRVTTWFTTKTVTSTTSTPATVSVVSGRASHQRRNCGSVSSRTTSAIVSSVTPTAANPPYQRVSTRRP
ncbi:MAG TPA: hypothetical protein VGH27_16800 [Streptosporangiaceae bacterium]